MKSSQADRRVPLTEIVQGLPETIPFTGPEELERRMGRRFRLRLGANESVFGISPVTREAMRQAADRVWRYGDPHELLCALSAFHDVPLQNLVLGSGIDDLLGLAVRVFMEPGDVAVTSLGAYPTYLYHVAGFGGRAEHVPYLNDANDLDALGDLARRAAARMVYLSNPDNPTGSYLAGDDIRAFVDGLPSGCMLVLDEAYAEFTPESGRFEPDPDDPRVIRTRTFSKAHGMAGARIGYALGARETISAFNRVRNHFGINRIAEEGALASLGDREFVDSVVRRVAEGRTDYQRIAHSVGLEALPSAANFVAFDIGAVDRADALCERLLRLGAFVRKSNAPPLSRCIRVTVGTRPERQLFGELLAEAMGELAG